VPRRRLTALKLCRWSGNRTVAAFNTVIARLFFMGGVAPLAVVAFEILLNATALFNHSNVQMPVRLGRVLPSDGSS